MQAMTRLSEHSEPRDDRRIERFRTATRSALGAIRLVDVSDFGCQFEVGALEEWRIGQFVEIDFGGNILARAIIRWCEPYRMGLEFSRALSNANVNAVVTGNSAITLRRL